MPTRLLSVEHRTQEVEAGCLAACVQMALHHIGIEQSQRHLNQILGLTSIGVPYPHITRLERLGVQVSLQVGDQITLQQAIERNSPIIAFLFTGDLPYWQRNTRHAILLVGYDDINCYINDPAFATAPQVVKWATSC